MPIYEYECQKCKTRLEVMQRITEDSLTVCPKDKCPETKHGKGELKKLISQTSFALKGGGWEKDGYS